MNMLFWVQKNEENSLNDRKKSIAPYKLKYDNDFHNSNE